MKYILGFLIAVVSAALLYVLFLTLSAYLVNPNKEYEHNSPFYRALLNGATSLCVKLLRIKIDITGAEKVPKDGRFLLVCNHRSKFDPILTWYVLKDCNLAFISKPENFKVPIFGRIIRKCCFMAIDREHPRNAIKTIRKAANLIKNDEVSVAVYPEGTRSRDMNLLPFHNGVFAIAKEAGVPVVVAAIQGTEKIYKNYPVRTSKVQLDFIDIIPAETVKVSRSSEIGDRVYLKIKETLT